MREEVIISFLNKLNGKIPYAIIHHVEGVFDIFGDIDLVVDSNKRELHNFITDFCRTNKYYYICHTIDLGAVRYNMVCFDKTEIIKIELDITYSNNNILGIKVNELLKETKVVGVKGGVFNTLTNENEYLIYLNKKAFKKSGINEYFNYFKRLMPQLTEDEIRKDYNKKLKHFESLSFRSKFYLQKATLLFYRFKENPSIVIGFLGPDGSGKTTIIKGIERNNPFINFEYYHLKPIRRKNKIDKTETNPHSKRNYTFSLSVLKLAYFIFEYNLNWMVNIFPKKITPILTVFDRYFDDVFADPQRYRYGASGTAVRFARNFIPGPDITFILSAPADVILKRKKEVSKESLLLQLEKYNKLAQKKNYFIIDVNRPVNDIIKDIILIILKHKRNEQS